VATELNPVHVAADVDAAMSPSSSVDARRLHWWLEALYVLGVYAVYSTVRNQFGSAGGPTGHSNGIAYGHAKAVVRIERALGLFQEGRLQDWYLALPAQGFVQFWNVYYGTAHFVITAFALVWLYRRDPERYPRWRNTLMFTTLLALVGFATFSLMPPRLLDEPQARYGPPTTAVDHHWGFVDTLAEYPTVWSFDSGTLKKLSNQYAAMPSMHIGWATWCALVLYPMVRRKWAKTLVVLYPLATFFCIVVTANHYWLDAVGGLVALAAGFGIATAIDRWSRARRAASDATSTAAPTFSR
jgi:hypothetical protein